mmetsp:Transcript_43850/g.91786  ORF Transcript_43850/g.91786 Transcript_43850/m.91786 type:complete len:108 (+) Transcript_43850:142-465(+)
MLSAALSTRSDSICSNAFDYQQASHEPFCASPFPDHDALILPDFGDLRNLPVCNTSITFKLLEGSAARGWPGKQECGWHSTLNLGVQILSAVLIVDSGQARGAHTAS